MAGVHADDDFSSKSAEFLAWLRNSNTTISSKIELADLRHRSAGRGVVAVEDIDEDEELFAVPRPAILTTDNSSLPVELRDQINDPWLSLILAMTLEFQLQQNSRWWPYFNLLPATFDTLMYWTSEELSYLTGSAVVDKIGKQSADIAFTEHLIPAVRNHQAVFNAASLSDEDLLALFHRMGSTIMAYAFDLEGTTQPPRNEEDGWEEESDAGETLPKGMVPLADMLNADADRNNAKLFYEEDKVVMKTITAVKKGDELFNDYGPLPRADVLRRYGYLTENYAEYDVVEISLDLVQDMAKQSSNLLDDDMRARIEYLEEQGIIDDGYDIGRNSAEDGPFAEEFAMLLNGLSLPSAEFEKLKKKDKIPKAELSKSAVELLYQVLVYRRSQYPDSNGQESFSTSRNSNGVRADSSTENRRYMANQIINGEKQILHEATAHLNSLIDDKGGKRSAETFADDTMHEAKRQKAG